MRYPHSILYVICAGMIAGIVWGNLPPLPSNVKLVKMEAPELWESTVYETSDCRREHWVDGVTNSWQEIRVVDLADATAFGKGGNDYVVFCIEVRSDLTNEFPDFRLFFATDRPTAFLRYEMWDEAHERER